MRRIWSKKNTAKAARANLHDHVATAQTSWMRRRRCKTIWPKSIGQVAQGAGELSKIVLARPPTKLDEEAGMQAKSGQKVPSWMAKK